MNSAADRGITSELYGGGPEMRLQQEMILGIGGWRVLRALGIEPEICHLNEGHAAFAVLERARCYMEDNGVGFEEALTATQSRQPLHHPHPGRGGLRPLPRAPRQRVPGRATPRSSASAWSASSPWAPSRRRARPFNMAYLAIRASGAVNGVSRLHGEVSRRLFQPLFPRWPRAEVPVGHVTNGVHVPSWDSPEADALWTKAVRQGALARRPERPERAASARSSDEELWAFRDANRRKLIAMAREHVSRQGPIAGSLEASARTSAASATRPCSPWASPAASPPTSGWTSCSTTPTAWSASSAAPTARCSSSSPARPIPPTPAGKAMIRQWTDFIARCNVRPHVIFLVDYDMDIAEHLVHGVDLWINTPRRPWEASGTSGMKVLVNGGLNLSELDGWWAEAYAPEVGWALGDGLEHDADPAVDAAEAERLYDLLENEIIPEFYDRDEQGIPRRWIARVRESMARLTPQFSTNRMMEDYLDRYYLPGAVAYRERAGRRRRPGAAAPGARHSTPAGTSWRFVDYSVEPARRRDAAETAHVHLFRVKMSSRPGAAGRVPRGGSTPNPGRECTYFDAATAATAQRGLHATRPPIPAHADRPARLHAPSGAVAPVRAGPTGVRPHPLVPLRSAAAALAASLGGAGRPARQLQPAGPCAGASRRPRGCR